MNDASLTSVAYIGLGGNIGDSIAILRAALTDLDSAPHTRVTAVSHFVRSKPLADMPQADYTNAVARMETTLSPLELLTFLQSIETAHGRVRAQRWGDRTLDLDILVYDDHITIDPRLSLPHPGMAMRDFVLYPLRELTGDAFTITGLGRLDALIADCPSRGLVTLEASWPVRV